MEPVFQCKPGRGVCVTVELSVLPGYRGLVVQCTHPDGRSSGVGLPLLLRTTEQLSIYRSGLGRHLSVCYHKIQVYSMQRCWAFSLFLRVEKKLFFVAELNKLPELSIVNLGSKYLNNKLYFLSPLFLNIFPFYI